MRWLIDGYNVVRRDADLKARETESLEAGRAALLALVARVARDLPDTFTVVFDGARRGGADPGSGRVQVIFSRPPASADDELRRLAASLRQAAIVVSSDRAVQDAARRADAVAISAEQFLDATDRASDDGDDDPDDDDVNEPRRGQAHRRSRTERAAERALRRLRNR